MVKVLIQTELTGLEIDVKALDTMAELKSKIKSELGAEIDRWRVKKAVQDLDLFDGKWPTEGQAAQPRNVQCDQSSACL